MVISGQRQGANNELTARELAELAGTTVRTIHYYASEGLLPAPGGSKRDASYTAAHLARLRLVGALREEGLSLAGIRARLAPLTDQQALEVVEALDRHLAAGETDALSPLRLIDAAAGAQVVSVPHAATRQLRPAAAPAATMQGQSVPQAQAEASDSARGYLDRIRRQRPTGQSSPPSPQPQPAQAPTPEPNVRPEAWYHFRVADGVELRVREDRFHQTKGRLHAVVDGLRATLQRYGMLDRDPPDGPPAQHS